ncbi:MAG: right-handed parallel beta-helix repeat-containing protein [Planctomycetaceae bacterium]|nr:right-handed parallel beta-helix repeat-containing protein [Planctomycetaceae bacterium]
MRWNSGMCCCLVVACLFGSQPKATVPVATERQLTEFSNDDGTQPNGSEPARDDSSALQKALNAGPGIVRIGPGTHRIQDVTIPENVTVIGAGPATVLQAFDGRPAFLQQNAAAWRLRDLSIQGEATGEWQKRTDRTSHGMVIEGCWGYEISGVTIRNCDGAGLQITRTNNQASGFTDGGMLTRITARDNFIGIRFDTRAEYITASHLHCHHNVTGLMIHAGNTNIASSNIGENIDGLVIADHENGSHGSVTGCLVNHNQRYALWAKHVDNGMAISNCCFFYGTVRLENSCGVNITSGLISASIATEGPGFNRLSGNHIIPLTWTFEIAPSTLLEGNFTKTGPWEYNRP